VSTREPASIDAINCVAGSQLCLGRLLSPGLAHPIDTIDTVTCTIGSQRDVHGLRSLGSYSKARRSYAYKSNRTFAGLRFDLILKTVSAGAVFIFCSTRRIPRALRRKYPKILYCINKM
jgi:hypothetical protein